MRLEKGGAARWVLVGRRRVVKVPRLDSWRAFLCGLLCNLQERELSAHGWEELCPVVFALPLGLLVVMPRAEVCTAVNAPSEDDYRRMTSAPCRCVPAEWKPDSWGYLEGRLVAADYG